MNLALFDLDHTLINCDSDNEWSKFLMRKGIVDQQYVDTRANKFYRDYLNGCLNIEEFLVFQLEPLTRFSKAELDQMHHEFMQECIVPNITDMAKLLVQSHQNSGDELMLISATNEFLIEPVARYFGIKHFIGVSLETDEQGNYTGRHVGVPSFKQGKVTRFEQWLAQRNQQKSDYEKIYFYSDSHNDLPLLQQVNEPVAVNPDEQLLDYARQHGWPVLNFI